MTERACGAAALWAQAVTVVRSGAVLLQDFAMNAAAGEVIALTGPNGAGKSTALKALAGLIEHAGSVQVFARDLRELSLRERARTIAYVPQQSALQRGIAARDVVAQGRYAHAGAWPGWGGQPSAAVQRALAATHLTELATRAWDQLSGGEQRRVLLARALATEAPIVLLDEPTAALDVAHSLQFLALLRELAAAGRCIVIVLHDLQQVRRFADTALLLDRGRIVASGATSHVIAPAFIRDVYGVELEENAALSFRLSTEHSDDRT